MHLKVTSYLLVVAFGALDLCRAVPYLVPEFDVNATHNFDSAIYAASKRQDGRVALRIMPLGASIVSGTDESQGNGFV